MHTNEALLAKLIAERESVTVESKPVYDAVKRIGDVICASAAICMFSPLLLGVSAAIMLEDPGSPITAQTRVGKDGKEFRIYKFRTTVTDTAPAQAALAAVNERRGTNIQMKCSPRTTRLGALLRRTAIEGLPQLFNVLKGDMSIIGPRSFTPQQQAQKPEERLLVKPGLSCYWQLSDRNALSKTEQIELDRRYIKERSLWTDLKLIGRTFRFMLGHNNS